MSNLSESTQKRMLEICRIYGADKKPELYKELKRFKKFILNSAIKEIEKINK